MIINSKVKGALLHSKRAPFTCQKMLFYSLKGRLLECKRALLSPYSELILHVIVSLILRRQYLGRISILSYLFSYSIV